jgi:hypothetical protein
MQFQLLGKRLAQATIVVDDQYSANSPHHLPRRQGGASTVIIRETRFTRPRHRT